MAFTPSKGNPRNIRELFYWCWNERKRLGEYVITETSKRVRWVEPYVFGDTYQKNDMVLDDGWTMIANKDTSERAAPQPIGTANWVLDTADPDWVLQEPVGTLVISGNTFLNNIAGYSSGYRVYIPEVGADIYYQTQIYVTVPGGEREEELSDVFQANAIGWITHTSNARLMPAGTLLEVLLGHENRSATATEVASYEYSSSNTDQITLAGFAHRRNNRTYVTFNETSQSGFAPGVFGLADVVPGTHIVTAISDWTVTSTFFITGENSYRFEITGNGNPVNGLEEFTFIIPTGSLPQPYEQNIDYWNPQTNPNVTGQGVLYLDGVEQTVPNNAYGTDVLVQPANLPTDWDVVAPSSTLASSGATAVALSFEEAVWVQANALPVARFSVSTTDNTPVEVNRTMIPVGEALTGEALVMATRTDIIGTYFSKTAGIGYNDGIAAVLDTQTIFEVGDTLLSVDWVLEGDESVLYVTGRQTQDWDWTITTFLRDIEA
jgi:hypothetical protein